MNGHGQTRSPVDPADSDDMRATTQRRRITWSVALGALAIVACLVGYGAWRHLETKALAEETLQREQRTVPTVRIKSVSPVVEPRPLDLPGTIDAFESATLFARATGYISKRNVDIGSRVHGGDLLATIAAPDLDQQLAQARAQLVQLEAALEQARATEQLARANNERTSRLVVQGWQSQQQGDTDRLSFAAQSAGVRVAAANLEAQKAQVSRLEQLTGFERVTAPFDGVITARQVDAGSLVTADTASGTPLFSIARTNTLRVQAYVPQDAALAIKDGSQADITVPELPGRTFHGTIARNANALQAGTRTLLTEVDIDNSDGTLHPGLYCTVRFAVPRTQPVMVVPAEAVIFDERGLSVAVFTDGKLHLRHIELAADNGAQVEVKQGLNAGEYVVLNPPVTITDGMPVNANGANSGTDRKVATQ
ncbi:MULTISPECIES: efflux RND transporter periplasmic adaptor subunit [unclassified Bradyrhizobium]|uniref:efflux RND transporter periplasmic adaptor subunit n=1 Tax=unclassified Bradyrhizobium TaxID=2631580 RepID=UPI0024796A0D|nr:MULTISPECIES: efflux RND transporter periplasmic adaptor subunit [unclassified Bradyrhizobium]WGR68632.1 efflux RND transporter periplasmic adaptor subunit [Bradyrhizobium sp. ISRA426]WGR80687.1 efflux RND transporter periplasmic adaptor subunit [Bradyrhizobium sp. ISRA430]WGR83872.1 efflux RND transporter periplasmic adaptor subunit [Bradyrhizobium sp. ISRA432]